MFGFRNAKEYLELNGAKEFIFDESMIESWDVWCAMATQWRYGMNGVTGLDYSSLPFIMDTYKIQDRESVLNDLRVMEAHQLGLIRDAQAKANKRPKT